jgi:uncharacterized protein (TIGR03067 family)
MRCRAVLILTSVALLAFAPAPFQKAERRRAEDAADVAGTWAFVLWERRGERDQVSERRFKARMSRETFDLVTQDGEVEETFVMRLEPAYSPTAFTWASRGRVLYAGSYRLQRDEITMIFKRGERVVDRPTDFRGSAEFRFVLRRVGR